MVLLCLLGLTALGFLVIGVVVLAGGDVFTASVMFGCFVVCAALAGVVYREIVKRAAFLAWLASVSADLARGYVWHEGRKLTYDSQVRTYHACFSLFFLTFRVGTRYYHDGSPGQALPRVALSLVTLAFGWWGLPFGPIWSAQSLYWNLTGGKKEKLGDLLFDLDVPDGPVQDFDKPLLG